MQTVELPRQDWTKALDEFSLMHEGWLVSLDVLSLSIGAQRELRELPLVGITAEPGITGGTISISAGRPAADHVTHTIHSPTRIWIERTDEGADAALEIESAEGTTTILRFRTAALPQTVDGIVRR